MKQVKGMLLGFLVLVSAVVQAELKVGVLDVQRVILTVEEGKQARQKLEKLVRDKEEEFKKQREQLKKQIQELDSPASLLSKEARMEKEKELEKKKYDLMSAQGQFQEQVKGQEMQATQKIAITASKLSHEIAKKENFDFIFEAGSSGLIYAKNPVDITPRVISAYKPQDLTPPAGPGAGTTAGVAAGPGATAKK